MLENGKPARGTPLFRIEEVLKANPNVQDVTVYAGDVADVCRGLKIDDALSKRVAKQRAGQPVDLPVADLSELMEMALASA